MKTCVCCRLQITPPAIAISSKCPHYATPISLLHTLKSLWRKQRNITFQGSSNLCFWTLSRGKCSIVQLLAVGVYRFQGQPGVSEDITYMLQMYLLQFFMVLDSCMASLPSNQVRWDELYILECEELVMRLGMEKWFYRCDLDQKKIRRGVGGGMCDWIWLRGYCIGMMQHGLVHSFWPLQNPVGLDYLAFSYTRRAVWV